MGTDAPEDPFLEQIYGELRGLAQAYLARERPGHTLQATALVNEALLRLIPGEQLDDGEDGGRLYILAARAMRRVLTDHARKRAADRRGGGWERVSLAGLKDPDTDREDEVPVEILDEALTRLSEADPRLGEVVELHYFAGLTGERIAGALGVHRNTVVNDLRMARSWLLREIDRLQENRP